MPLGCHAEAPPPMMDIRRVPGDGSGGAGTASPSERGEILDLETSLDRSVPLGGELRVAFASNAGTGYEWVCQLANDPIVAVDAPPEVAPVDTGIVGGRIRTIFVIHGKSLGVAKVTFVLVRPWEKGAPPAKSVTLTLTVAGSGSL